MTSIYFDKSKQGFRIRVYIEGVERKLWLGKITKAQASAIAAHLDALKRAKESGEPNLVPANTKRWTKAVAKRIRQKLESWGLVEPEQPARFAKQLHAFCDDYIASQTEWAGRTVLRMHNVQRHLTGQLGRNTPIAAITQGDGERFAKWARSHFRSQAHAGKVISDAKQFFLAAVKERIIEESPFAGLNASQPVSDAKKQYVPLSVLEPLIEAADPYLAAIIAMARFGGVRVPSELLTIQWQHVNWERGRIEVYAPKKRESREMPIFPELRPHLTNLFDMAPEGATWVFDRHRGTAAKVYRTWMLKLLKSQGVDPWPDLWRNLRYSRKNDLLRNFKEHVVCDWIGHDRETGRKHYDRATDQDFLEASR